MEARSHIVKIDWIQLITLKLIELTELSELSILRNQQRPLIPQEVVVSFVWLTTYSVDQLEPQTPVVKLRLVWLHGLTDRHLETHQKRPWLTSSNTPPQAGQRINLSGLYRFACKTKTAYKLFKFAYWKRLNKPVGDIVVCWNIGGLYMSMLDFIPHSVVYHLYMLCTLVPLRIPCQSNYPLIVLINYNGLIIINP